MLLDALSAAADEITRELAPGSVEVRLRGGEPEFVVTPAPADEPAEPTPRPPPRDATTPPRRGSTCGCPSSSRPRSSRPRRERLSVNAWLVRAAAAAVATEHRQRRAARRPQRPVLQGLGALT